MQTLQGEHPNWGYDSEECCCWTDRDNPFILGTCFQWELGVGGNVPG